MNVVVRGLMAAGMGVYGTLHLLQALEGSQPVWMSLAFGLTALLSVGLVVALIAVADTSEGVVEDAAAALVVMSAVALTLTLTTGFFGVEETLRVESVMAYVAEGVVLASWLTGRLATASSMEETSHDMGEVVN